MRTLASQFRYSIRGLRHSPAFTISALIILTLGIGANTAIFSVVNAVLLKPLPFPESGSIVTVFHTPPPKSFPGVSIFAVSPGNYLDWRTETGIFESISMIGGRNFSLGGGNRPRSVLTAMTEPGFFGALRVQPAKGRVFTSEECQPGRDAVIVLSHGFAESHFGSAEKAVGQKLELNARAYQVIGVMPASFRLPSWSPTAAEAWAPIALTPEQRVVRGNHNLLVVARLREGVTLQQAQARMDVLSAKLARDYPEENTGWGAVVTPLREFLVGDVRTALLALLGAVGFVLLIACANTANLVLARTIARRKELAIRAALGASAGQTLRPVLLETTILSVAGGALGLLFAQSGQSLVIAALADQMPRSTEIKLDAVVLGFTFVASVLTGLAAGMIACWRVLQIDLNESLKQGLGKTDAQTGGNRTRSVLVVCEVALSLMLLVGAGLMIRTLWALRSVNPGFDSANVLTMSIPIPQSADGAKRNRLYDEFLPQVRAIPGVASVGAIDTLPISGGGSKQPVVVEGRPAEVFALQPNVDVRRVTPGYVQTMRIPIVKGRDFVEQDTTLGNKAVVLISESMARQFWPGEDPIGKHLRISFTPKILREVVGVVGDVKDRGLNVLDPVSFLYEPMALNDRGGISLVVRTNGNASGVVASVTQILNRINPELPVREVQPMEELVATSLSQQRFSMFLFAALAGLAFLLAAVGVYSVLAYSVRRRVHEIGIRLALGAETRDVLRLIIFEGMRPTVIGLAIGILGAYVLSGLLSRLIYGVSPTDPSTFATVALLLACVSLIACVIPAYRATRVDPLTALRNE